ncbi:MAG: asparagine synthetase B, partial [Planococcaceae bacterium]|nr:asparagine synthetase B [Planococcaceae bacterium]
MCGITGWVHFQRDLSQQGQMIEKMTKSLAKRGPDDENMWLDQHVALGHRRLTVVDPIGGKQPMTKDYQNRRYILSYNGELYNTEDLRSELLKNGHTFSGHSDTEVLLTSYIQWKEKCVDYFNGIFAFAIWDSYEQKLFVARDRLGVKPLFYAERNSGFIFGSELKAVLAHQDVSPTISTTGLAELLSVGPSRKPGSGVFDQVNELRPAHALTVSRQGLRVWRYWNVKSEKHTDSLEETAE